MASDSPPPLSRKQESEPQSPLSRSRERGRGRGWFLLSLLIVGADQATKALVTAKLAYGVPLTLLPMLDLTLLHNTGASFSMLSDAGGWQRWLFAGIAVAVSGWIAVWLHRLPSEKRWLPVSLALILGGALGNLIDRLAHGYVVDFISVHWGPYYFPAFNVADAAISIGAAMMLIDALILERRDHAHTTG